MKRNNQKSNNLIYEKSPYLLQHAHNPIQWFPWGEAAFTKAKQEEKPIFLSIGYSTCHWCHVMERESFEDEEVAAILNKHFVAIKVDREERPDIDHIYMTVCQALTGHGGWPLTILMTPEQKPFFAGTYFPKQDRRGKIGVLSLLNKVHDLFRHERKRVEQAGEKITNTLRIYDKGNEQVEIDNKIMDQAFQSFKRNYDQVHGGFGDAPKFPRPHDFLFLLRYHKETQNQDALEMVVYSLQQMSRGGIFDHLGGGFARYSVDREWLVPHFEKMLYDNALLAMAYLEAYQVTGDESFADVARSILTYVKRDMTSPQGGFYSAEDADSEGVEGKFYVWTRAEILEILGTEDGNLFCLAYDVTEKGNFEASNILNRRMPKNTELTSQEEARLSEFLLILWAYREKRIHPLKDDKILTAWNGLMIAAFARAARVLQNQTYLDIALKAKEFVLQHLVDRNGRLQVRYREGEVIQKAFLDDYAFLSWGLLELYDATFDHQHLEQAIHYTQELLHLFRDPSAGGLYFYGEDSEQLLVRPKEFYDGAMPSGNSVATYVMTVLAQRLTNQSFTEEIDRQVMAFAGEVSISTTAYSFFLCSLMMLRGETKHVLIMGDSDDPIVKEMRNFLNNTYLPNVVVTIVGQEMDSLLKLGVFLPREEKQPAAYICKYGNCGLPVYTLNELKKNLLQA